MENSNEKSKITAPTINSGCCEKCLYTGVKSNQFCANAVCPCHSTSQKEEWIRDTCPHGSSSCHICGTDTLEKETDWTEEEWNKKGIFFNLDSEIELANRIKELSTKEENERIIDLIRQRRIYS